jgi:hypothetical protein
MDFDDEEPPSLVDVTVREDNQQSKPLKVPITIVTGKSRLNHGTSIADIEDRLSRSREDNFDELYSERATWKEDCRDPKW